VNILVLWIERLWRTKQSPARRHAVWAIAERANVKVSGPGFPDWTNDLSGVENIQRIMPDCHAVLTYKALAGCEFGRVNEPLEVSKRWLTVETWNECHAGFPGGVPTMHPGGGTAAQECRKAGIRLVVIHHENDRARMWDVEDYGAEIVHIPHGASPVFMECRKPWSERRGVILTGVLNEEHYPLRQRWYRLIRDGRIPATQFSRPGNYSPSIEESEKRVREYAEALGSARVVLGCASKWKYALARYPEVALSGAAHVCDLPDAVAPGYDDMLHAVQPDASADELISAVEYTLAHAEEIGVRAAARAEAEYTTAHYAQRFMDAVSARM